MGVSSWLCPWHALKGSIKAFGLDREDAVTRPKPCHGLVTEGQDPGLAFV